MIYRNSELIQHTLWLQDANPEAGEIAYRFLSGERELLRLARTRTSAIVALTIFLEATVDADIYVDRGANGDLLISTNGSADTLLITGKTADVLRAYIDDEPVSMQDRADMTARSRIA